VLGPRPVALVPAAGRGERFGGDLPKQFLPIAGRPMLAWTLERLLAAGMDRIVVGLPPDRLAGDLTVIDSDRVDWIAGGATRQETVARCLAAATGAPDDLIVVHDGARPAVSVEDIAAVLEAARHADGAVLGRPLADTLKRLEGERIETTVDRHGLFRAETPQIFRRDIFCRALAQAERDHFLGTDESALVERLPGARVIAVAAHHPNPKLTEPADRGLLERLLLHT
jgi:2-C-methyl-D-erythritol 4-phosphate cytidylyltransferase